MVKACPHCRRLALKDDNCNFVICGRSANNTFFVGMGCGKPWCYHCGKKLCGQNFCERTGQLIDANEDHNHTNDDAARARCEGLTFCPGGHNSHKK